MYNALILVFVCHETKKINIYLYSSIQQILIEYFEYSRIKQQVDNSEINNICSQVHSQ